MRFFSQTLEPAPKILLNSKKETVVTSKTCQNFETFFRKQKICGSEKEFGEFLSACRLGLPSVFRVILSKPQANLILTKLRQGCVEIILKQKSFLYSWGWIYKTTWQLEKMWPIWKGRYFCILYKSTTIKSEKNMKK